MAFRKKNTMNQVKKTPIEKIIAPVSRFIHLEYTSGIILLMSVMVAILWANSSFGESYHHLWEIDFSIAFGKHVLSKPLHIWINDGLMSLFFFVIGLELKREFMDGELSSLKKAAMPMGAALGGMLFPALIYTLLNINSPTTHGWGIPMATDIAFALALLSMAGNIPTSVKVFLSALAVADDLGAVMVIAFFYTDHVNFAALGIAGIFLLALIIGNKMGVRNSAFYLLIGICVWIGFLLSGVHATIAGVLVAFTIPAMTRIDENVYSDNLRKLSYEFEKEIPSNSTLTTPEQHRTIQHVKSLSLAAETPLQKIEHALHPWVAFLIMPLFALSNSGILIGSDFFTSVINPVTLGVASGLIIGKFIGILLFTWIMVRTGIGALPAQATWKHIMGIALLAGVGFTMSLFISGLAFKEPDFVQQAKYGILIASVLAGLGGYLFLRRLGR